MTPMVTATTLTALVVLLANLQEEGTLLIPEVFLCEDLEKTLQLLPDRSVIEIGTANNAPTAISQSIKKCGPLAIGGWCIFICPIQSGFRFGLFRGSLNPLSVSVSQTLFSEPLIGIKVVRLFKTASGCVELCNHLGTSHCILLNDRPETASLPNAYTEELVALMCRDISESVRDPAKTYMGKTIDRALAACHGTLIAVTKSSRVPVFLRDGVLLKQPLDLQSAVLEKHRTSTDTVAEHRLVANASLVRGMISSDGITVFNTKGKLLAYSCFIRSPNHIGGKPVVGGARTRAYEALCKKIGNGIEAVFIQSQDGWTKFSKE